MTLYKFTFKTGLITYVYAGTWEDSLRTFYKTYRDTNSPYIPEIRSIEELEDFEDNILVQLD